MAGAWFHPTSVLSLCKLAMEQAHKARSERFYDLTREDASPPSWWPWKGRGHTDEELSRRYFWVWNSTEGLPFSALLLRGHILGPYWRVEAKVNKLRQLAQTKAAVNDLFDSLDPDRLLTVNETVKEVPGTAIYLTDDEFEELDITTPLDVRLPHELNPN